MKTQNMIRKAVTKITAMLMSAIYLAVSVNVPVLAQDVSGPITRDTYEGDVAVAAGAAFSNNVAGVYATNANVSVGNDLSVTDTGSNSSCDNLIGVCATNAEVSVGNNLSVASGRNNTKGIYADPNVNEAVVTIGNDLTVDSNASTNASTMGIVASPAATGTAKIKVGNPLTNQGDVTVTGTVEVMGIRISSDSSNNQDNTNITVGGDVKSSISESNGGSAKGVYLNSRKDDAETNVDIGGAVNATGSREAMGLEIKPTAHNTNEIYVGKGISASAAKATGVSVPATNTSNTSINIGKDSSGDAITVDSNGNNDDAANSSGISAQLNTYEGMNGSTTATINVEGNIVVRSEAAGARGIYADGGDRSNLNVQVKGDVTSNGAGIYTKDMSSADSTNIIIDGTVKSTADNIPAVILDDSSINNGQVSITAWKIESNDNTALLGKSVVDENNIERVDTDDTSQAATASRISYIIRVTQPEINNTPVNVISLANADGTAWNTKKAWNNGERAEPTMLDVAKEDQKVYVNLDVPDGYQIVGVYADAEKTVAFSQDENGSYFLDVPRGGGIDVNVDLKPADPVVPADIRVTGVKLDKTTAVLDKGDTVKLTAKVIPDNATNKKVTWKSDKEGVARVDQNGTVTAVEEGAATITVTTEDGGYTDTCKVTVKKDNSDPEPEPVKTYTIRVKTKGKGTATADPTNTRAGQKVIIKATSKAGYKFKKWTATNGVSLKDAKKASTSFIMPDKDVTVKAIFEKIYEAPQPELEPVDDNKILLSWQKVDGAKGYDIFMSRDNKGVTPKLVKTIEGNKTFKWTAIGLKPRKSYKALIKAYVKDKKGKKQYISESPLMYVFTAGGNKTYTNAKSVKLNTSDGKIKKNKLTLKVKDTYKIKASVKKADKKKKLMPASHVKTLRYRSSDTGIATVSSKGKITAKKKGKCNIYVYAHNGVNKTIKLTVK